MLSRLLVTGEGSSDMGGSNTGQDVCSADTYNIGPMAVISVRLLKQLLPDWNVDMLDFQQPESWITHVSGNKLATMAKALKKIRPSKKLQKGHAEHAQRALAMITFAQENAHQLAIYFHDTDREKQAEIVAAINLGFLALDKPEASVQGVAMVPKPTSVAWFICAVKENAYQHCEALEEQLSGNDSASEQNAPKKVLARLLDGDCSSTQQLELAQEIDLDRLSMPSFNHFKTDLTNAARTLCGH